MAKERRTIREVIAWKARTDGRYAVALGLLAIADELDRAGNTVIAESIAGLSEALQRMRPMVTVETAPVPARKQPR